jgi:hypothetical protein
MSDKDWIIAILLVLAVGGPLGVHFFHKRRGPGNLVQRNPGGHGPISDTTPGMPAIDDNRRIGSAIAMGGGRAFTEGAKAGQMGGRKYGSRQHGKEHMRLGGQV